MKSLHQITIVGLGLIGGSLAARVRKVLPRARVVGVSRSRKALSQAKNRRWIHEGTTDLRQGIRSAGLVVLCTPVDTFKGYLKRIDRFAQPGTVVTDAGSVKGFLVRWADRQNWRHIHFVGAHPMAGSHRRGIEAADPALFDRALTFVTPGRRTSPRAFRQVRDFWKRISRRVIVMNSEAHDRFTAQISHLPHLVAALLVAGISPQALRFAASGFLDTTRIAQGDPALWMPIFLENRREIRRALRSFKRQLRCVEESLQKGGFQPLKQVLIRAQRRRLNLE